MAQAPSRSAGREKRHERIRLTLRGSAARPRLAVFRSIDQIYAQVIDDTTGRTLAAASSLEPEIRSGEGTKTARARIFGRVVAEREKAAGVGSVVFYRAGFRYHGRVKSLADAAREAGLDF